MDDLELKREVRLQRAFERLGCNHPQCVICGNRHPHELELHHVGGRDFDDTLIVVCRNCHQGVAVLEEQWVGDNRWAETSMGGVIH